MDIVFHIGKNADLPAEFKNGILDDDTQWMYIERDGERYFFSDIRDVALVRCGGFTAVRVINGEDTVHFAVAEKSKIRRNAVTVRRRATKKAADIMKSAMHLQSKARKNGL